MSTSERGIRIDLPKGAELSYGPSSDSDSALMIHDVEAEIMGEPSEGSLPLQIVDRDGHTNPPTLFLHLASVIGTIPNI